MATSNNAKFSIGEVVKHRHFDFRGVIYDVDFEFNNSEEWYQSIPKEVRPRKDQPFYHLLAESNDVTYEAYVSEQNLLLDKSKECKLINLLNSHGMILIWLLCNVKNLKLVN